MATQESTQVRKYITHSASLLSDSSNEGNKELQNVLANANGDASKLDGSALNEASDKTQRTYNLALNNEEVPPEFDGVDHYLVSALGIRAEATEKISKAAAGDPDNFVQTLSSAIEDYKVSDSIIRNEYIPGSKDALDTAGQRASNQSYLDEPQPFMDYEQVGFKGATPDNSTAAVQDDPNALHGVEITTVEVGGQQLYPGGSVTLTGSDKPIFKVTVTNGGEVAEHAVPVEVILNTKAERQSQKVTIESIAPNRGAQTVEVSGFKPGEYNETADVTVEAGPVKYEKYEDNNTLKGSVAFGL